MPQGLLVGFLVFINSTGTLAYIFLSQFSISILDWNTGQVLVFGLTRRMSFGESKNRFSVHKISSKWRKYQIQKPLGLR